MSKIGAPFGREGPAVVWTGTEMLVWGQGTSNPPGKYGGIYHPKTDSWTPIYDIGVVDDQVYFTAVWDGGSPGRMLVWTGRLGGWYMLPLSLYQKP